MTNKEIGSWRLIAFVEMWRFLQIFISVTLPLALISQDNDRLTLLQFKTRDETGANSDGTCNITICTLTYVGSPELCCHIYNIDDPTRDDWEQGALDDYRGDLLQSCKGISLHRAGQRELSLDCTESWGAESVKLILDSGTNFTCPLRRMLDSDYQSCQLRNSDGTNTYSKNPTFL